MITYRLGTRQQRSLLSGQLRVAIPYPAEGIEGSLVEFARSALPESADLVVAAEEVELLVCVPNAVRRVDSLTCLAGAIVGPDVDTTNLVTVYVLAVEATLRRDSRKGSRPSLPAIHTTQWPARAVLPDGRVFPPEAAP